MQIDVIIPCYNRATTLPRAINSVLAQTHQEFNLIVIDDGSTDETSKVMETQFTHPKIQYLKKTNGGVSSARNLGIQHGQSEWIAFLDSDDEWLPQKLQAQLDHLLKHPELNFIHSNEIWIRNGVRVNPKKKFDKDHHEIFLRSLELCLISPSTVMMKKKLLTKLGCFDENYPVCEDYDLWLKVLAQEDIGFIPQNLILKYGGHEDQLSLKFPAMDFWRIKSMINLLTQNNLSEIKRNHVIQEIHKKAPVLLNGYLKYSNTQQYETLTEMLRGLPGR